MPKDVFTSSKIQDMSAYGTQKYSHAWEIFCAEFHEILLKDDKAGDLISLA